MLYVTQTTIGKVKNFELQIRVATELITTMVY